MVYWQAAPSSLVGRALGLDTPLMFSVRVTSVLYEIRIMIMAENSPYDKYEPQAWFPNFWQACPKLALTFSPSTEPASYEIIHKSLQTSSSNTNWIWTE